MRTIISDPGDEQEPIYQPTLIERMAESVNSYHDSWIRLQAALAGETWVKPNVTDKKKLK